MSTALISNPPYNMKWTLPPFAQIQPRFNDCELPPENNANYAFVLTGLSMVDDRAVFLLPASVLTTKLKQEELIRRYLVDKNLIESVILCPGKMFESTDVVTCIITLNKKKDTTKIVLVDMTHTCQVEERQQNGQFGGKAHTGRTYTKQRNIFSEDDIKKAMDAIGNEESIKDFSVVVTPKEVQEHKYLLSPGMYFEVSIDDCQPHREYADIIDDLNRVIKEKNGLKLTMNESIAKSIGVYELFLMFKQSEENNKAMNEMLLFTGKNIEKENFIRLSKNAGEIKFENGSKDSISTILMSIMQMWKQHIMYLNNEENRYLIELRDALLPDLMSGKIEV